MNTLVIDVIYEKGVLRPASPLPLQENEKVQITINLETNPVRRTAGNLGWKGDAETIERVALDPEFSVLES